MGVRLICGLQDRLPLVISLVCLKERVRSSKRKQNQLSEGKKQGTWPACTVMNEMAYFVVDYALGCFWGQNSSYLAQQGCGNDLVACRLVGTNSASCKLSKKLGDPNYPVAQFYRMIRPVCTTGLLQEERFTSTGSYLVYRYYIG